MHINLKTVKKIYINSDINIERKLKFENNMTKLDYINVERFSARILKKQGAFNLGCSQSHHDLMIENQTTSPLFLLEDDAAPTQWYSEYVIDGILEVPNDADVIYLGYSTGGDWKTIGVDFLPIYYDDNWMKLKHCLGTHAILFLNKMEEFIKNSKNTILKKIPLDVGYAKEVLPNINVYAPTKGLFYQWDKCWPTTNVICTPALNTWTSFKENGELNFQRRYSL